MNKNGIKVKQSSTILKVTTLFVVAFLFAPFSSASNDKSDSVNNSEASHKLYFALPDKHAFPQQEAKTEFDCSDKIYSVIELTNFKHGRHAITIVWTDPSGTDRERTEYPFSVFEKETRLWGWLELSRARGAGMLQWLNPAAGLEEFIGPWVATIYIDGKKLESGSFEVLC
ncbi:hypothetical protein [Arenicella xantha]|nr:hypothetical protein [Arenicella xantha]